MQDIIDGFFHKKHFWFRLCAVVAAVIVMGFCLSWLLLVDLGTDPGSLPSCGITHILQYYEAIRLPILPLLLFFRLSKHTPLLFSKVEKI